MEQEGFVITGGFGFGNAIRRTLLSDISTEAPHHVRVHVNTTCLTDEFLAHRIGLIPFKRVGNGHEMTVRASGPCVITSSMITGPGFEAIHGNIEIARMNEGSTLEMDILFASHPASKHARYSPCSAVGMERIDRDRVRIQFCSNDHRTPKALMQDALTRLEERVDRALHALANQPETPPKSYC